MRGAVRDSARLIAAGATLAAVLFCLIAATDTGQPPPRIPKPDAGALTACDVLDVQGADAVTVMVGDERVRVRFIGVYVPGSGNHRDEARLFLERMLRGEQVYLAYEPDWPPHDMDGRRWAYVFRAPDGLFVNLELVRQGYARLSAAQPFEHQALLRAYEGLARQHKKGLWRRPEPRDTDENAAAPAGAPASQPAPGPPPAAEPPSTPSGDDTTVYVTPHGNKYHRKDCQYVRDKGTPISLKDAKARGCTPCSRCKPPQ